MNDHLLVSHADFEVVVAAVFLARPPLAVAAVPVGALTLRVVKLDQLQHQGPSGINNLQIIHDFSSYFSVYWVPLPWGWATISWRIFRLNLFLSHILEPPLTPPFLEFCGNSLSST